MSLQSKIEAVIYASEEPVTLQQLVGLLAEEAQAELDSIASNQASLPLEIDPQAQGELSPERAVLEAGTHDAPESAPPDSPSEAALRQGEIAMRSGETGADATAQESVAAADTASEKAGEGARGEREAGSDGESWTAQDPPVAADASSGTEAPALGATDNPETANDEKRRLRERERSVREHIRWTVDQLMRAYAENDRGIEIREVASGFRMGTKPEYHDAVRGFVKSLKPALKLTLPALETLAVVAYKQPVTAAEISEIRGVDSAGVLGGLMARKLIATAGRKQVIGRPMLYKTTRDFLLRFGLKDVNELPSMEEFERMAGELVEQEDLPMEGTEAIIEQANVRGDAEMLREAASEGDAASAASPDTERAEPVAEDQKDYGSPGDGVASENDSNDENREDATAESAAGGTNEESHTGQQDAEQPISERGDDLPVEEAAARD